MVKEYRIEEKKDEGYREKKRWLMMGYHVPDHVY